MKVIAVTNQKGGVGKTTTTANLASEISRTKRVLVIDLDPQGNCSKLLSGGRKTFNFNETSAHLFDKPKVADIQDMIKAVEIDGVECENFHYIAADFQLSRVIETSLTKINRERILSKHLQKVVDEYDYVLLDTPPNLSLTTLNAIQSSDLILIPIDSGAFSLDGINPLLTAVEEIKEEVGNYLVLRNEIDSRNTIINNFINEELEEENIDQNMLQMKIRRSEEISQANALSLPLRFYKRGALANNDYRSLAQEIYKVLN